MPSDRVPPHEVLDVRPDASIAEITDAFRRFALRHHPDRGGDPERFQDGLEAYRRLTDSTASTRTRRGASGRSDAEVVFHRSTRPGVTTLLRQAGRRLAATRTRS
ncbi:MAG TPA: DnaJ domain-containing protein [Acidimicrobiales bacterium]|nr:DnaJ domain-containing protein [Acidimicrobiales bacterium]